MPRGTRFERERISKLLGHPKTKPIQKPQHPQKSLQKLLPHLIQSSNPMNPQLETPQRQPQVPQVPPVPHMVQIQKSTFKASSYLQVIKIHDTGQQKQIQKFSFKCYDDQEVFGDDRLVDFLKQNYDNDHDTPQEQVKYDVNRGIKKLKEEIQRRRNGESQAAQSQRALSLGSTPPRFIKIKKHK